MKKSITVLLSTVFLLVAIPVFAWSAQTVQGNGYTLGGESRYNYVSRTSTITTYAPFGYSYTTKNVNTIDIYLHSYKNGSKLQDCSWYRSYAGYIEMTGNSIKMYNGNPTGDTFKLVSEHVARYFDSTYTWSGTTIGS